MDRQPKRLATVLWLIDNHSDELEYELIRNGLRLRQLGTPQLSWHDIWIIAAHAPPKSPLAAALDPRMAWDRTDWWLRSIEHSLRWLVWAKTKEAAKNRGRPKPLEPPGGKPRRKDPELTGMGKQALNDYLKLPRSAGR